MKLTEQEELFLAYIEKEPKVAYAAKAMGISYQQAYNIYSKLKDVIMDRARSQLTLGAMKAVHTTLEMLDADASTEKILDRVGITKHTNVEVRVESENGLFILPAKVALQVAVDLEDPLDEDS